MTDLMLRTPQPELRVFILNPFEYNPFSRPLQISAKDLGYEIDEQDLVEALTAAHLTGSSIPNPPDVDPDDFERLFGWCLS